MIRKESSSRFSKLSIFSISIILTLICCTHKNAQYQKLESYFQGHDIEIGSNYRCVLLLTENECPTCNRTFCSYMLSQIQDPHTLFVISASGTKIDISGFDQAMSKNVIIDDNDTFLNLNILDKSGIIVFKQNDIDTIIPINANNLTDQLAYVSEKIRVETKSN